MVALDDHGAFGGVARDGVDDRLGISAVAHQVAQERVAADAGFARMLKTSAERLDIGVNVGKQCDDQRGSIHRRRRGR